MKRVLISILAILYLTTSIGITLHYHYCMGKLVSWELREETKSNCSKCGMLLKSGSGDNRCCKNEWKHFKNDKDQDLSEAVAKLAGAKLLITAIHVQQTSSSLTLLSPVKFLPARVTERSSHYPLNIINCTFRI